MQRAPIVVLRIRAVNNYTPLNKIPILGSVIRSFDSRVKDKGFIPTMRDLLAKMSKKPTITGRTDINDILVKKPVIVILNHPYDFEIVAVFAALPKRTDVSAITHSDFITIGPNTAKYIIPVYIHKHVHNEGGKLSVEVGKLFNFGPEYAYEQEHRLNIESINIASEKVNSGGMVVMLPQGPRSKREKWYDGIGYLLKNLKDKENVYVIMAQVKGTSNKDYFRFIPGIKWLMPRFSITFSSYMKVSDIMRKETEPKKIAAYLELLYNEWISLINLPASV